MITIRNTQRLIPINIKKLRAQAQHILTILGYADFDLGIWLTSEKTIRHYNKQYRSKDVSTDILSFAYHPDLKAGERIEPKTEDDKNLGDLILAPAYIKKKAPAWDQPFDQRLRELLVHGICHLLGYDHETDADFEVMQKREHWILKQMEK
jgi:probable rRNA maturation factor